MAFPTLGILDNFNRGDEDPATNWTDLENGVEVVSNELQNDTAGTASCIAMYDVATYGADCEAYFTIVDAAYYCNAVFLRGTTLVWATFDGYCIYSSRESSELRICRCDDGSLTELGAAVSWKAEDGDKIGGECIGSTIKGYVDDGGVGWAEKMSRSDATYGNAGYVGVRFQAGTDKFGQIDDFGGGTIAAGGVAPTAALYGPLVGPMGGPI